MRLETPIDLLERLRAQQGSSWYALAPVLGCTRHTVANWKNGRTSVDRKFAPRIAELLHEPAEYVLACLEADREQDAEVLKVWRRIAERFRSKASILLVGLVLFTASRGSSATVLDVELGWNLSNHPSIHYAQYRAYLRRLLRKLFRCLKPKVAAPLTPSCARRRSRAFPPPSWRPSAAFT
jgi:hypothetical protein